MTNPTKILHFTLGPVQGFIGDARRTRDFWAGSFLLSWLSGHAMAALDKVGGKIDFPQVAEDDLFNAIRHKTIVTAPYIGSLPNRFKADVSEADVGDVKGDAAKICKQAITNNWKKLADAVWNKFIKSDVAAKGNGGAKATKAIWDRQVNNFWDINWVVGDKDDDDGRWLDQRKNWRTHIQKDEPGDLCRLMGRYQELSGYHRIHDKDKQKAFWDRLAEKKYHHPSIDDNDKSKERSLRELNLKDNEYLCAIALIKRLFPLIAKDVIGWQPGGDKLSVINWPSVSYVAALPWLKGVKDRLDNSEWTSYWNIAQTNIETSFMGETETRLFNLTTNGIFKLDGHLLHEDGVRSWKLEDLKDGEASRQNLISGLKDIQEKVGGKTKVKASEFYAVLIMDGDRIGAKIGEFEKTVSTGLATFTKAVKIYFDPATGNPANGVLIYAGGDDVLAFVPVDTAIEAATALHKKYKAAFVHAADDHKDENAKADKFTMSGALVFAQYKIPLRAVLRKAHHYLDNIAKDKNGRDSLALAVMKPGGIAYDWVSGWGEPVENMEAIAKNPKEYSNSFFYNVRARYAPVFESDDPADERETQSVISDDPGFMESILKAEYKKQFSQKQLGKMPAETVDAAVAKLKSIGHPTSGEGVCAKGYHFDGALVASFLSAEGRWNINKKPRESK